MQVIHNHSFRFCLPPVSRYTEAVFDQIPTGAMLESSAVIHNPIFGKSTALPNNQFISVYTSPPLLGQ